MARIELNHLFYSIQKENDKICFMIYRKLANSNKPQHFTSSHDITSHSFQCFLFTLRLSVDRLKWLTILPCSPSNYIMDYSNCIEVLCMEESISMLKFDRILDKSE